ncbi:MAG: damage-control phosphatase ARMT1 family protein [Thermodesulfovibrionales bacterium]
MKVHLDCFPCFLKQSIISLRLGTKDEVLQERILKSVLSEIQDTDLSKPPAYTTTFIHRKIRHLIKKDPFREIKSEYNKVALRLFPSLKRVIEKSPDPLWTGARLAIAGNVIDFGIFTSVDIEGSINRSLNSPLAVDDYTSFKEDISKADRILYLADNAGEIVFDRLFIEVLISMGKKVTVAVKGSPVINDATREDAQEAGISEICDVTDNGSDAVGTILPWTSSSFQKIFRESQIVISKGQGNFETLTGTEKKIFFLFQSKCDVVSKELGLSTGSMLLKKS